jgi:uncharacterized membrane protein YphA (DoxX/SURF4 family)
LTQPAVASAASGAWKTWLERVLRWALSVIFLYAAYSKIADPAGFAEEISYYHMLPLWATNWMAIFLPWLELLCGLALLSGIGKQGALILVIAMLVVFTYAIGHAVHEGRDIRCGCFGHGESAERVGYLAIARDLLMLAAASLALGLGRRINGRSS